MPLCFRASPRAATQRAAPREAGAAVRQAASFPTAPIEGANELLAARGRFSTTDRRLAEFFSRDADVPLGYVDVEKELSSKIIVKNLPGEPDEFILTDEMAGRLQPVFDPLPPVPEGQVRLFRTMDVRRVPGEAGTIAAAAPPRLPAAAVPPEGEIPAQIAESLDLADAMVQANAPHLPAKFADIIPGVRQLRTFVAPAARMSENIRTAWVARTGAQSKLGTDTFQSRLPILNQINDAFGPGVSRGAKADVRFLGTEAQASSRLTGTFLDIAQNPDLYELNAAQRAVLQAGQTRNLGLSEVVNTQYGAGKAPATRIRQFPVKTGGMHLSNVDVSEQAMEVFGSQSRAAVAGRGKTRIFATARDRLEADRQFVPETNVEVLLTGMDMYKENLAGNMVFRAGLGGKTRLEVLKEVQPKLAKRMTDLRKRLQSLQGTAGRLNTKVRDGVDEFLASPFDDIDLALLRDALDVKITRGARAGMDARAIQTEINAVRTSIRKLQPAWKAANLRGNVLVTEGGLFRYFPVAEAKQVRELLKVSDNRFLDIIEGVRNVAFNFDLSPLTGIQLPLGAFADPYGVAKQFARGLRVAVKERNLLGAFSAEGLAKDVAGNLPSWQEFAFITGRPITAATPAEFSGAWLKVLPGYRKVNEGMFTLVTRVAKRMYDDSVGVLEKQGISHQDAIVAAGDEVMKVMPLIQGPLLGQSAARAALFRGVTISPSFILRPAELAADATRGYLKLGLMQTLSPKEQLAVRLATVLIGSIEAVAFMSAALTAKQRGQDPLRAGTDALTPGRRGFMSLSLPSGDTIGLGGPFRSLINLATPREVRGSPIPLPFAWLPGWAESRITPVIGGALDIIKNKDFYDNRIVSGEFPENIIRGTAYLFETMLPLTARSVITGLRTGETGEEIRSEGISQFLGVNLRQQTPSQERNVQVEVWARREGLEGIRSYYDLSPPQRQEFDAEFPEVAAKVKADTERRAEQGQPFAVRRQLKQEAYDNQLLRDEGVQRGILNGRRYTQRMWENDYFDAQVRSSGAREMFERLAKPSYREPDTTEGKALDGYYKLMDTFRLPAEQFDSDGWRLAEQRYIFGLSPDERTYVEERIHPNATPYVRRWLARRGRIIP